MTGRRRDGATMSYDWLAEREYAERADCPRCGARKADGDRPAEHCHNPVTGDELHAPSHFQRIDAANVAP